MTLPVDRPTPPPPLRSASGEPPDVNSVGFWQTIYDEGDTRWDIGGPTPVFVDLRTRLPLTPGTLLIPGCGRGYDAIDYALHGFEVTGVDFAPSAVHDLNVLAESQGAMLTALQADFFTLGTSHRSSFDYVIEYVVFCAIEPRRRDEYVDVMFEVMKPGGLFIGLFYPLDDRPDGPPFAVSIPEIIERFSPRFVLELSELPALSHGRRAGKEQLMLWRKPLA